MRVDQWIDTHAHFSMPTSDVQQAQVVAAMRSANWLIKEPPRWDPESTLAYMDRTGIAMQMLSNIPKEFKALQASNDYGASIVRRYPNRFGFLAALPTDDPDAALAEINRASIDLHADGFAVTCRYNDVYLSDSRLDPVWAELDRRTSVVFAHPDAYVPGYMGRPSALVEVAFETARTVADMLYAGTFRLFPNMTMILAHCGGSLPALSGRLLLLGDQSWVPNPNKVTVREMRDHLQRLYLDTAATCPTTLAAALAMTTFDKLVYGSDCGVPCTNEATMDANLEALMAYRGLTLEQIQQIGRRAQDLFPAAARRSQS